MLEELGDAGGFEGVGGVGAGFFAAESGAGKSLSGLAMLCGIEGVADELHGVEVGLGEHVAHGLLLLAADAVLAGDGAAVVDAEVQDAVGEVERDLFLAGDGLS